GALLAVFVGLSALLYRRLFLPQHPTFLDDFEFTPWEFQADYEEVDLVTADGVAFGAWFFRQSGSPQVIVISPGHKGRRQDLLGAAGDPSVEALVLDSPFSDLRQVVRENVRRHSLLPGAPFVAVVSLWIRLRNGVRLAEASPIAVLSGLEPRPLFFIHGGADT